MLVNELLNETRNSVGFEGEDNANNNNNDNNDGGHQFRARLGSGAFYVSNMVDCGSFMLNSVSMAARNPRQSSLVTNDRLKEWVFTN